MNSVIIFSVFLNFVCLSVIDFPVATGQVCPSDKDKDWSWDPSSPNGPQNWGEKYPDCNSKNQSPININKKLAKKGNETGGLKLTNYGVGIKNATIKNKGYTVLITPTDGVERSIEYNGNIYYLRDFHFHWGNKTVDNGFEHNSPGSEHTINKNRYSMEMHVANVDKDNNIIGVVAFLEESNYINPTLDSILKFAEEFQYYGDETEVSYGREEIGIDLEYMLQNRWPYYTYEGSGTYPPCKPNIRWIVSSRVVYVTIEELFKFEKLYTVKKGDENAEKCHMVNMFRPLQPLDGRTVYFG